MSLQHLDSQSHDAPASGAAEPPSKSTYRSFKKKFHKMKLLFDDAMKESDKLFKEEQKIIDILRRLQAQNDQILDFLLEINDCPKIPRDLRYNIDTQPSTTSSALPLQRSEEPSVVSSKTQAALSALGEAKKELQSGEISLDDFQQIEDSILRSEAFAPAKSLAALEQTPHTMLDRPAAIGPDDDLPPESLALFDDESYSHQLDLQLGDPSAIQRQGVSDPTSHAPERTADKERDIALRNPVSVYNWLRKHQPQVFLQDNETNSEKASGRGGNTRGTKRASLAAKHEEDVVEEEAVPVERGSTTRGKRKRDDEPYRPKGGSSRPIKRKREDGQPGKRGKKSSISDGTY